MTGDGTDETDFFISHAGPDAEWASWIGQQLVEAGYSVELDVWDWAAGTDFVRAMERALHRARRVITVFTAAYFERTWTRMERHAALADQAQGEGWLVPVMVAPCEDAIPKLLRTLIRIDVAGLTEQQARSRLLDGVAGPKRPARGERVRFPGGAGAEKVVYPAGLPAVWNLPARNLFFTGREALLADLARRLGSAAGRVAVSALQGVGGVGKSQLALEYAWRHTGDYQTVWWVDAATPAGVDVALVELAAALRLPVQGGGSAVVATHVFAELARRTDWLLIYDNVGDPRGLDLPTGGHVIVTCRDAAPGARMPTLPITVFARAESVQLLRRRTPHLPEADADRIAALVGDLPLAVAQAGAYLAATGVHPDGYLRHLAALAGPAGEAGRPGPATGPGVEGGGLPHAHRGHPRADAARPRRRPPRHSADNPPPRGQPVPPRRLPNRPRVGGGHPGRDAARPR
jgi:hypothetical protein